MTEEQIRRRIGEIVLMKRRRMGVTQEELAGRAGLRTSYISDIERGRRNFSVITLLRLCSALEEPPEALLDFPVGEISSDSV